MQAKMRKHYVKNKMSQETDEKNNRIRNETKQEQILKKIDRRLLNCVSYIIRVNFNGMC